MFQSSLETAVDDEKYAKRRRNIGALMLLAIGSAIEFVPPSPHLTHKELLVLGAPLAIYNSGSAVVNHFVAKGARGRQANLAAMMQPAETPPTLQAQELKATHPD
jgi:hypothetical protein